MTCTAARTPHQSAMKVARVSVTCLDAREVDQLVEAVAAGAGGAVGEAGDAVVAAVEAAVGDGGQDGLARLLAVHTPVRGAHGGLELGARLQHVVVGLEAVPDHSRRIVGQERVLPGRRHHHAAQLLAEVGERHARQHGDAAVDLAPGGRRARPVAAGDLAGVELDRVGDAAEPGVRLDPLVELAGVAAQRLDQAEGGEDGIGAALALADVHGPAADAQAEPHDADGAAQDPGGGRLRDQAGVGAVAARQRRERAVAGRLLLGHGLHVDVGGGQIAGRAQRVEREHHGAHARLHVVGAAAVHAPVLDRSARTAARTTCRPGRSARRRHGPAGSGCGPWCDPAARAGSPPPARPWCSRCP